MFLNQFCSCQGLNCSHYLFFAFYEAFVNFSEQDKKYLTLWANTSVVMTHPTCCAPARRTGRVLLSEPAAAPTRRKADDQLSFSRPSG